MGEQRSGLFARGALVAAVPLLLLFLPLFVHRSADPVVGPYGRGYLTALVVGAAAVVAVTLLVGWACRRARSLFPAFALVLAVAGVVVAGLVAELALTTRLRREDAFAEYRAWGHKRSLLFAFEAAPNNRWTNVGATYSTDAHGFRTHVRGPWDAATTRIFTVGESSVFGYGLNDDETWPHLLEEQLRAKLGDPSLAVVNAGNNGHTSIQTLFRFYAKVVPEKPTHVIVYLGPNDIYGSGPDKLLITEDILFSGSVAEYWAAETAGTNLYARSLLFYALQRAVPALAPRTRRAALVPADAPVGSVWGQPEADAIAGRFIANVRTLCLVARAHGIEPVLVTFMHDLPAGVPFPPLALRTANARLRALAAERQVKLFDMEEALRAVSDAKDGYFFADHYHPSRKGAALIATTIADAW